MAAACIQGRVQPLEGGIAAGEARVLLCGGESGEDAAVVDAGQARGSLLRSGGGRRGLTSEVRTRQSRPRRRAARKPRRSSRLRLRWAVGEAASRTGAAYV